MDTLTKRFVGAYNDIDVFPRRLCQENGQATFASLVKQGTVSNAAVRMYADELREYGDLRNVILHRYRYEEPIATPLETTVKRLENIRDEVLSPKKLRSLFSHRVMRCAPDDLIGVVSQKMLESEYSQIPVCCDQKMEALLTTNTIARWLANSFATDGGVLEDVFVHTVLAYAEHSDNYTFLDPDDTVFDALECFTRYHDLGKRLDAILLTQHRNKKHAPVGIITVSDVPKLHRSFAGRGTIRRP